MHKYIMPTCWSIFIYFKARKLTFQKYGKNTKISLHSYKSHRSHITFIYLFSPVRSTLASRNDKFTKQYNVEKLIELWNHSIYIRFVVLPSSWIFISRRPFLFAGRTLLLPGRFTRLTLIRKPFKFLSGNEPSFICRT